MRLQSEIEPAYRALCRVRDRYGWTLADLQEALRQEWEIFYGKRHVGGLAPLEAQTRVLVIKRRHR